MEDIGGKIKEYFIERNKRIILKNYYSKEIRKGKTYRASFLDKFLLILISFLLLLITLTVKSQDFFLSLYISIVTIFFSFNLFKLFADRKREKNIREINKELKKKRLIRELSHLNKEGFIDYSRDLLENYKGLNIEKGEGPLDLFTRKDGRTYGIRCYKIGMDDRVRLKDLEDFQEDLNSLAIDRGIAISNSYFREEDYKDLNIEIYDLNKIIEVLEKLDKYLSDKEIQDYILDNFMSKKNKVKKEIKSPSIKRILQLYGVASILYLLSYIINYPLLYKFISVVSFVYAIILSWYKLNEYLKIED